MVPRPLQKLGGDSILTPLASTVATPLGILSLIPICPIIYVLTLIKAYSIFVAHTSHGSFVP